MSAERANPAIVLRVDASPAIGMGHLSRSLTLARAFERLGARCVFVSSQQAGAALSQMAGGFERHVLQVEPGGRQDALATAQLAAAEQARLLIADGYPFRDGWLPAARLAGARCAYIDDYASGRYECDALLNHNVFAAGLRLDVPEGCLCLLGPEYALVKPSFGAARLARGARSSDTVPQRIAVTLGGSDPTGTTLELLRWLRDAELGSLPAMHVRVVLGPAFAGLAQAQALAAGARHHQLEVVTGLGDLAELFAWADLIVTAGGVTCLEVACVGVPMLVLCLVDNQRLTADGIAQSGLAWHLGDAAALRAEPFLKMLADLRSQPDARRAMVTTQHLTVDGQGASRAAGALLAAFAR